METQHDSWERWFPSAKNEEADFLFLWPWLFTFPSSDESSNQRSEWRKTIFKQSFLSVIQGVNKEPTPPKHPNREWLQAPSVAPNGGVGILRTSEPANSVTSFQWPANNRVVFAFPATLRGFKRKWCKSEDPTPCSHWYYGMAKKHSLLIHFNDITMLAQ